MSNPRSRHRVKYQFTGTQTINGEIWDTLYGRLQTNTSPKNPVIIDNTDQVGGKFDSLKMRPMTIIRYTPVPAGYLAYPQRYTPDYVYQVRNPACFCGGTWNYNHNVAIPDTSQLVNQTLGELSGSLPEDQRVNIIENLTDMATLKAAVGSVTNVVKSAYNILQAVRGLSLRQIMKHGSDEWLAVQLVAMPLVSDVKNVWTMASNVQKRLNELSYRNSAQFFSIKKTVTRTANGTLEYSPYSATRRVTYTSYWKARYDISDLTATILMLQGMNLTTPLYTAWQCLPLSFVIDYVYDMSARLQAWDELILKRANSNLIGAARFITACQTDATKTVVRNYHLFPYDDGNLPRFCGNSCTQSVTRGPLDASLFLSESALNRCHLTTKRVTTMGALVVSRKLR